MEDVREKAKTAPAHTNISPEGLVAGLSIVAVGRAIGLDKQLTGGVKTAVAKESRLYWVLDGVVVGRETVIAGDDVAARKREVCAALEVPLRQTTFSLRDYLRVQKMRWGKWLVGGAVATVIILPVGWVPLLVGFVGARQTRREGALETVLV